MTAWLLTWLWQGAALAGGLWVALACARRLNAATRHLIWCGALAAVAWLGWASSPHVAMTALKGCATDTGGTGLIATGGTGLQPCLHPAGTEPLLYIPSAPDFLLTIFVGIWAAIALVSLLRLLPSLRAVYALRDRCRPFPSNIEHRLPLWLEASQRGRRTQLMICDAAPGATVLGFQRPCIAIPSSLVEALTIDELDQVILHEHAHVQRRDDWSRLAQTLLLSALWIHPAAWCVSRALNREREMACDEWVVARTGLPKAYARCLAHAAEVRVRMRTGSTLVPPLIGGRHELARRVDRLLAIHGQARRDVSRVGATVAACAIVMMSAQLQTARVFAEIAEIVLPQVSAPMIAVYTVRLSAAARQMQASFGETRHSLGEGGKPDTTDNYASAFAPELHIASADRPNAPDAPNAPVASAFAPELHIASADRPNAPNAPNAPNLSARAFPGAYSLTVAPLASTFAPTAHIASVDKPIPWRALAAPGVEIASAAKTTSVGIANVFSRAGVSLARSF